MKQPRNVTQLGPDRRILGQELKLRCPVCGHAAKVGGPVQHDQYVFMPHFDERKRPAQVLCPGTNQTISASP